MSLLIDRRWACVLSVRFRLWSSGYGPREKQANVVYEVPCTYGKMYIGEPTHQLGTRLREHKDACIKGFMDKSAIAEHAWMEYHPIRWDDTRILQHAS